MDERYARAYERGVMGGLNRTRSNDEQAMGGGGRVYDEKQLRGGWDNDCAGELWLWR